MRPFIFLLTYVMLFAGALQAQIVSGATGISRTSNQDPTSWSYEVKKLDRNEYELIFKVTLNDGWHIFSQTPGDSFLIPPSFIFDENKTVKMKGGLTEKGKLIETTFEGVEGKVRYFEGTVEFIQNIVYTGTTTTITGEHRYQICNDRMCLPPVARKFEFKIQK